MAREPSPEAERIIGLYDRHALAWDRDRGRRLLEQAWLDRFRASIPAGAPVLDLGCGSGDPIARYLIEEGYAVTGVNSSHALIALCSTKFPAGDWIVADMRGLDLGRGFGGLIAWNSFFHLTPDAQRRTFEVFERHARPGSVLMFTSGTKEGEAIGEYQGEPLYHGSLDAEEYRRLIDAHGFDLLAHKVDDPDCGGLTVWLARRR